jgi:hypothetical protein
MVSAMLTISFGTIPSAQPLPSSRLALVDELQRALGGDIKIVHGEVNGYFGNFGSSTRMAYTFLVPHLDMALAKLGLLGFGKSEEISVV